MKKYTKYSSVSPFFILCDVKTSSMKIGCIVSSTLMVLAAYLAPLLACVSEGMYTGSKINFLYFLSSKFWINGIVALPSHEDQECNQSDRTEEGLVYQNCIKRFGDEKVIGPLTVQLKPRHITTLLGPNGVGRNKISFLIETSAIVHLTFVLPSFRTQQERALS